MVNVHFGYRVGSEIGGLHYAVVLDVKNDRSSRVVTVVPLTSLKGEYKDNRYSLLLTNGLYSLTERKLRKQIELAEIELDAYKAKTEYKNPSSKTDTTKFKYMMECAQKTLNSMAKLKSGSVLSLSQITTISKQRINNPKMKSDSLFGIKLSDEDMSLLDEKLHNLYFAGQKRSKIDKL